MENKKLLRIEEVALCIGVSTKTIRTWYKYKRENPDNEFAKLLPEIERKDLRKAMYWNMEDVWRLVEFKSKLPTGRNGIMGSVTQKYCRKKD